MRNLYLLFTIILVITACRSINKTPNNNSKEKKLEIEGIWTEHWEQDTSETNVDYVDTLKIQKKHDKLLIKCINDNSYIYFDIEFKDEELKFTLENIIHKKERFFVYYTLKLSPERNLLKGEIKNSRGETNNVELRLYKKNGS
jgi:hypothetical protein